MTACTSSTAGYYLSCEEVVVLARLGGIRVVVVRLQAGKFVVEACNHHGSGPYILLCLRNNIGSTGAVRGHFERLLPEEFSIPAEAGNPEPRLGASSEKSGPGRIGEGSDSELGAAVSNSIAADNVVALSGGTSIGEKPAAKSSIALAAQIPPPLLTGAAEAQSAALPMELRKREEEALRGELAVAAQDENEKSTSPSSAATNSIDADKVVALSGRTSIGEKPAAESSAALAAQISPPLLAETAEAQSAALLIQLRKREDEALRSELAVAARDENEKSTFSSSADTSSEEIPTNAEEDDEDAAVSESSFESDASDLFHVAVEPEKWWKTAEDEDLEKIHAVSTRLRMRPLLPPHPQDPTRDWVNVCDGIRFPLSHCAFAGCSWTGKHSDDIDDHILQAHGAEIATLVHPDPDLLDLKSEYMAYYIAAIAEKERDGLPIIGSSLDRRTFEHLREVYRSERIRSLVCFICAQIRTDTCHVNSDIRMRPVRCITGKLICTRPMRIEGGISEKSFRLNFCRRTFIQRFAPHDGPLYSKLFRESGHRSWEWRRRIVFPDGRRGDAFCCPEDVELCNGEHPEPSDSDESDDITKEDLAKDFAETTSEKVVKEAADAGPRRGSANVYLGKCLPHHKYEVCERCRVPICRDCYVRMHQKRGPGIPMALANDNAIGYCLC